MLKPCSEKHCLRTFHQVGIKQTYLFEAVAATHCRYMLVLVTQLRPIFATSWTQPARLLCPWNSAGKNTGVDSHSPPRDLPDPGIKPRSLALQADSLLSEPPRKPEDVLNAVKLYVFKWLILCYVHFILVKKKERKKTNSNDYIYFTISTLQWTQNGYEASYVYQTQDKRKLTS